jgi:hypothetical protein
MFRTVFVGVGDGLSAGSQGPRKSYYVSKCRNDAYRVCVLTRTIETREPAWCTQLRYE